MSTAPVLKITPAKPYDGKAPTQAVIAAVKKFAQHTGLVEFVKQNTYTSTRVPGVTVAGNTSVYIDGEFLDVAECHVSLSGRRTATEADAAMEALKMSLRDAGYTVKSRDGFGRSFLVYGPGIEEVAKRKAQAYQRKQEREQEKRSQREALEERFKTVSDALDLDGYITEGSCGLVFKTHDVERLLVLLEGIIEES